MRRIVKIHKQQSPTIILPKFMCDALGVTFGDKICLDLDTYNKMIRIKNANNIDEDIVDDNTIE